MNIEHIVRITDSVAQVGRRPHGGGTYLAAWESHHHLDTVPWWVATWSRQIQTPTHTFDAHQTFDTFGAQIRPSLHSHCLTVVDIFRMILLNNVLEAYSQMH